jgi:hypothetical protein
MFAFDSEAEKRFTGTDTSPNEIVAVPMARAGIGIRERAWVVEDVGRDCASTQEHAWHVLAALGRPP